MSQIIPNILKKMKKRKKFRFFDDFSKKKYELVKKKMELSEDDFEKVKEVITSLNPIPSNLEKYNTKRRFQRYEIKKSPPSNCRNSTCGPYFCRSHLRLGQNKQG